MKQFLIMISLLVGVSCSNKEKTLTEFFPVTGLVDPAVDKLTSSYSIYAEMTGRNEVSGFGGGYRFRLNDENNILYTTYGIVDGDVLFNDFNTGPTTRENIGSDIVFKNSSNGGSTYEELCKIKMNPYLNTSLLGYNRYYCSFFSAKDTGWAFVYFTPAQVQPIDTGQYRTGMNVYKIEGTTCKSIAILNKNYTPVAAHFENSQVGNLLAHAISANSDELVNFHTEDGGHSWQGPFPLPIPFLTNNAAQIVQLNTDRYLITAQDKLCVSLDGCKTFTAYTIDGLTNPRIRDVHVYNENLIFVAIAEGIDSYGETGHIYKSTDLGKTWKRVSQKPLYVGELDFYDYANGLSCSLNVVQVTHDGGQTWKVVIFPILQN